jgi:uncharacterized membrane protein YiaA
VITSRSGALQLEKTARLEARRLFGTVSVYVVGLWSELNLSGVGTLAACWSMVLFAASAARGVVEVNS